MLTVKNFIELKKAMDNKEEEIIIDNPRIITLVKLLKNKWFVRLLYCVFCISFLLASVVLIIGLPVFFACPPVALAISPSVLILAIIVIVALVVILLTAIFKNYSIEIGISVFKLKLSAQDKN